MPGVTKLLAAVTIAALTVMLMYPPVIKKLRILKIGQNIREDGPQSHLEKTGTPTMGGIMIIGAICLSILIVGDLRETELLLALFSTLALGAVGFIDDYIKLVKKRSLGLRAWQKIILQLLIGLILGLFVMQQEQPGTSIYVPFIETSWDLGGFYLLFVMLVVVGTSNAVNLTDGLDGLATSVTIIVAAGLAWLCWQLEAGQLVLFAASIIGAGLGFLVFNRYPAHIFMGDTGSLALGGALAAIVVLTRTELFLILIGIVYVLEALSVIIQVAVYKATRKRVFLMSPLHHHFELLGYKETQVVCMFAGVALLGTAVGIISWLVR